MGTFVRESPGGTHGGSGVQQEATTPHQEVKAGPGWGATRWNVNGLGL